MGDVTAAPAAPKAAAGSLGKIAGVVLIITIVLMLNLIGMLTSQFGNLLQMLKFNGGVLIGAAALFYLWKAAKK
jgi:hypothetical protein